MAPRGPRADIRETVVAHASRARTALHDLPLERLAHPIFQRRTGQYYTLINYPPLKAMDQHEGPQFPFFSPTANGKRLYLHIPFCWPLHDV